MSILKFFFLSLMTPLIGPSFLCISLAVASENIASLAVEKAETAMISAFEAVIEAEQVGGNVSSLLTQLNEAGDLLDVARMSYRMGDFDKAARFADLSRNVGEKVKSEAYELKDSTWNENIQRIWFTIIGSISGVTLIILGSFWFWRYLKRRYLRRVLRMKPEITSDDS